VKGHVARSQHALKIDHYTYMYALIKYVCSEYFINEIKMIKISSFKFRIEAQTDLRVRTLDQTGFECETLTYLLFPLALLKP